MMSSRLFYVLTFLVALLPAMAHAQPFVEHIAPPVLEKGKTTRVTFVGKNLAGALDVWSSLPSGALKANPVESHGDRAVFEIEVSRSAPVGICGVRVATRDGLSNAHLFLIDDLPVKPRENSAEAMKVTLPIAVWGDVREAGIDRYRIDVQAGQRISFEVVASRFGKDADPLLTIRDSKGKWIAERDNDQGLFYDCRFEHQFKEAGTYTVEVRDSRFRGDNHHQYVLRMGRFPASRVAVPSAVREGLNELQLPETGITAVPFVLAKGMLQGPFTGSLRRPNDEGSTWLPLTTTEFTGISVYDEAKAAIQAQAIFDVTSLAFCMSPLRSNPFRALDSLLGIRTPGLQVKVPSVLCGVLKKTGERHGFQFELAKGQGIFVRGEAQALNSPADLELVLTDRAGKEVRRATDVRGDLTLEYTASLPGSFSLQVRDAARGGGDAFAYRLTVNDKPFPPLLIAEVEGLTVPQGSYQPVPIAVTRTGSTGPIKLKLLGAPPGLTLTPDEISEDENAIMGRLEADAKTPLGLASLQIIAETNSGPVLVRTQPFIDKQIINVDLIPHALREDQRRLPPSVTDRLAVQITPPAPFTMEFSDTKIVLPRYQTADIPIVTTRLPGFDGPITFTAKGGQLADKKEGRTRVYAEFPNATREQPNVNGAVYSKILSNIVKARIEMTGVGVHQGRRIALTRHFELDLTTAFSLKMEPAKVSLLPGESTTIKVQISRLKSFDGPVTVTHNPLPGITLPETLVVAKGQTSIDIPIEIPADAPVRIVILQLSATGTVNGFEEQLPRTMSIPIEVRKVDVPKKVETPKKK